MGIVELIGGDNKGAYKWKVILVEICPVNTRKWYKEYLGQLGWSARESFFWKWDSNWDWKIKTRGVKIQKNSGIVGLREWMVQNQVGEKNKV